MASTTTMDATTTTIPDTSTTTTTTEDNEKKRPRESDLDEDAPDAKRPRLQIDTTQPATTTSTTTTVQPQASTPISATPKSRLALLEKLKNKVSQIDNVIKEVPISQPAPVAPAPVIATPAAAQKITKSTPPSSNKKASKPKKPRPTKDADEYDPMSEEEQLESDNRPRRQRKPNRYTDGEDGSGGEVGSDPLRRALAILRACKSHKWSWPFLLPVDPIALNIPDYFNIVKRPMDLGTVEQKLISGEYADIWGFGEDVDLVWRNCFLYNQPQSDVVKMGEAMKKFFDDKFKKLSDDVLNPQPIDAVQTEYIPTEPRSSPSPVAQQPPKPKAPPKKRTKKTVPVDSREMSFEEKKVLSENIEKLDPDQMVKIVQIIQQRAPRASSQANDQEIEIDLDKLDAVTLRQLEKFVHTCLNKKKPKKKKPSAPKQQATPATTAPAPVQQPQPPTTASPTPTTTAAVAAPTIPAAAAPTPAAPAKDESESSDTEESSDDSSEESSSDDDDDKKPASSSGPQSLAQVNTNVKAAPSIIVPTNTVVTPSVTVNDNAWSSLMDDKSHEEDKHTPTNLQAQDSNLWSEFKSLNEAQKQRNRDREEKQKLELEAKQREEEATQQRLLLAKQQQEDEQRKSMEAEREAAKRQREQFEEKAKEKMDEADFEMGSFDNTSFM